MYAALAKEKLCDTDLLSVLTARCQETPQAEFKRITVHQGSPVELRVAIIGVPSHQCLWVFPLDSTSISYD